MVPVPSDRYNGTFGAISDILMETLILNRFYIFSIRLFYIIFRPWHLLVHESFTTREVSFEYNAEELGYAFTRLANLEESGTGIGHEVGLAALGFDGYADLGCYYLVALGKGYGRGVEWPIIDTAINDSAPPTYMNLIFALSLMGDMPTNKARTSDNAQKQSASNAVPIFYYYCFVLCSLSNNSSSSWSRYSYSVPIRLSRSYSFLYSMM